MAVIVKRMGNVNRPDENTSAPYSLHVIGEGSKVDFDRDEHGKPYMLVTDKDNNVIKTAVRGNCYVMDGKHTVATFAESEFYSKAEYDRVSDYLSETYPWFVNNISTTLAESLIYALLAARNVNQTKEKKFRLYPIPPHTDKITDVEIGWMGDIFLREGYTPEFVRDGSGVLTHVKFHFDGNDD